jgi:hypothetical protein
MANHVNSYIEFVSINDAAKQKLIEMGGRIREDNSSYEGAWFGDLFVGETDLSEVKNFSELTYEDVEKYSWTTGVIGPKWCYIQDYDFNHEVPYMQCMSAWSAPTEGLEEILEILEQYDEKIVATIRYEDEMPNFVGWYVYEGSELYDGCEDDEEEIREAIFAKFPEIAVHWDDDNDEWQCDEDGDMTDEAYEAEEQYRDSVFEYISEGNEQQIDECVKYCLESQEERFSDDEV